MRKIQGDKSGIYSSDYKKNAENTNRKKGHSLRSYHTYTSCKFGQQVAPLVLVLHVGQLVSHF